MAIPEGYVMKVSFPDPLGTEGPFERKVIDISAGGLSFGISEAELPLFPTDLKLNALSFTIAGRKIQTDAEIRHARLEPATSRRKGGRVGVKFRGPSQADTQHIAQWVFEESRRFLSRFLR